MIRRGLTVLAACLCAAACLNRPTANPGIIVASLTSGPNNLDPRVGTDDSSQKIHPLIFDSLVELDDHLRIIPKLAERLEHPDPLTYIAYLRHGVKFHDGRELTAKDVAYTFHFMQDPSFVSAKKGGFQELDVVETPDPYTVVFRLKSPFESFPINVHVLPIIPDGAGPDIRRHPIGTGPYRFVKYDVDDKVELSAFEDYFEGRPKNDGLVLKIVPDEVMRGLEVRKGTIDLIINDVSPDIAFQLQHEPALQLIEGPGVDYQYIGINHQDAKLSDLRVRQALAYAIDRQAIVSYLRRDLAHTASGMLPALSWAVAPDLHPWEYDPARARTLLDQAGFPDPDGDGPAMRFALTLKVSNVEFNRLQASVVQQNLRDIGVALDVRTYEFATLYADVLSGNFQLFFLQWTAGSLADPDILRRVFHTKQAPPVGFNRGRFSNPRVDDLLDRASSSLDPTERLALYQETQRVLAEQLPYISLWHKTNIVVARRSLSGVRVTPLADFLFLKDVARTSAATN